MNNISYQYIELSGKNIFSCIFKPKNNVKNCVILMCYPFGIEHLYGQRVYFNFANFLCKNGFDCILFDYEGFGDSSGDFINTSPETNLSDTLDMINFLNSAYPNHNVGLFGLRLGGYISILASLKSRVDFLILWSPVLDGEEYLSMELRKSISSQGVVLKKIVYNRNELKRRIKGDFGTIINGFNTANIDGYIINKEFVTNLERTNLLNFSDKIKCPTLLIDVSSKLRDPKNQYELFINGIKKKFQKSKLFFGIEKSIPWEQGKFYYANPINLIELSYNWIISI